MFAFDKNLFLSFVFSVAVEGPVEGFLHLIYIPLNEYDLKIERVSADF